MINNDIWDVIKDLAFKYGLSAIGIADTHGLVSNNYSWARTAISCAFSYPHHPTNSDKPTGTGIVASFSMGSDYHRVLSNRLLLIADCIGPLFPGKYTVHVDDPQISERAVALRSGIGWIGHNQCLYVPNYGSYVVLGEILTDLVYKIQPVQRTPLCGNCTLCVEACPTGALSRSGSYIRENCISHLTQSRGMLDAKQMSMIADHVYGCDICQSVCPHNRSETSSDPEMTVECYPGPTPSLSEIIQISASQWKQELQFSSVGWIGRNTWRRNAIIASGNTHFYDAEPIITQAAFDTSPIIASTAKWSLAHMFA